MIIKKWIKCLKVSSIIACVAAVGSAITAITLGAKDESASQVSESQTSESQTSDSHALALKGFLPLTILFGVSASFCAYAMYRMQKPRIKKISVQAPALGPVLSPDTPSSLDLAESNRDIPRVELPQMSPLDFKGLASTQNDQNDQTALATQPFLHSPTEMAPGSDTSSPVLFTTDRTERQQSFSGNLYLVTQKPDDTFNQNLKGTSKI